MAQAFQDIRIESFDDQLSYKLDKDSAIVRMTFVLTSAAPVDWSNYFNQAWDHHIYMMKRRARVIGQRLYVDCVPDEFEREHLPELKKVFDETNRAYAAHHAQVQAREQAAADREAAEKAKLADLKKNLKFD